MKIVHIRWIDTHALTGAWLKKDEYEKWFDQPDEGRQETVGFLAREDDNSLMVIQSFADLGDEIQWDAAMKIPKFAVREMKILADDTAATTGAAS